MILSLFCVAISSLLSNMPLTKYVSNVLKTEFMALCPVGFESKEQEEGTNSSFQTMLGETTQQGQQRIKKKKKKMLCKMET